MLQEGLAVLRAGDRDIEVALGHRLDEVVSLLERYMDEIELFNPAYGLVGARTREELVLRHILDSLAPLGHIIRLLKNASPSPTIADVGSGAGLPGIPLSIALPDTPVTLIERMGRRVGFLRNTQAILGLPKLRVEEGEMERVPAGRFDLLVFRAFRPLVTQKSLLAEPPQPGSATGKRQAPPVFKGLLRLLAKGGVLAACKGRRAAIAEEMAALEKALGGGPGSLAWEALPCPTPFLDEERHLVLLRKNN